MTREGDGPGHDATRRRLLLLAAVAFGLVVALRVWLELVGPLPGERRLLAEFPVWPPRPGVVGELVTFFDLLGRPLFAAVALGVSAWLVGRGSGARDALLVVSATAGVAVNAVLKALSGVTPLWAETHPSDAGLNYPSGHTVYAVVLAGALAVLAHRRGRRDLVAIAAIPIVLMGPLRVLDGVHLASDVVAGYLFGLAWLAATVALVGRTPPTRADA